MNRITISSVELEDIKCSLGVKQLPRKLGRTAHSATAAGNVADDENEVASALDARRKSDAYCPKQLSERLIAVAALVLAGCSHHNLHDTRGAKVGILTCESVPESEFSLLIHSNVKVKCSIEHASE